jgi:hypothetical protein
VKLVGEECGLLLLLGKEVKGFERELRRGFYVLSEP